MTEELAKALTIGDTATAFTLPRDGGGDVSLSDFQGKKVVFYLYPKDMTPGCTTESFGFSELEDQFSAAGALVIGCSRDSVARHDKFRDKHDLKVILASDEDGAVCEDYGVWVEKKTFGLTYMGIERATFLIDGDGIIRNIWRKVRVKGHVEDVLKAVKAL